MWNAKGIEKRKREYGCDIWATVFSPTGAELSILCTSRADQRRKHAASRAAVIAALGLEPEQHGPCHPESYCATTGELVRSLRERQQLSA